MSTPYEPVIRHEVPPFSRACQPCVFQSINEPCGLIECNCTCNLQASAPVALEDLDQREDPTRWHEPPAKPEDIETWIPGPLTVPPKEEWTVTIPVGGGNWGVGPYEQTIEGKSSSKVDLLPFALLILALNVIGLVLAVDTNRSIKAVLIVSAICAAIVALLSIQREKE